MIEISGDTIKSLILPEEVIESVKSGILKLEKGDYKVPERLHLENEHLTYLVMPAMGTTFFCTKLVSFAPNNRELNKPVITGAVILHNARTGIPIALIDAPTITALRTAAVGAIGLELISDPSIHSIGVIGCGTQGLWQAIFANAVREIVNVFCYSRTKQKFETFKRKILQDTPHLNVEWCGHANEVVQKSDVIYGCTTSNDPVFSNDPVLIDGKRFISVGSFRKDMQEFPDAVYQEADHILIDTETAMHEVGDIINSVEKGWKEAHQILTLGAVLSGKTSLDPSANIVFKSVGMAAFDLALAEAVYLREIQKRN